MTLGVFRIVLVFIQLLLFKFTIMRRIIFSIMMLIFLAPVSAFADIAPDPGFHEVCSHVYIDNLGEYPDFDVYATKSWRFGPSAIEAQGTEEKLDSECYGHGNSTSEPFFAIKVSDQENIVTEADGERGDNWDLLEENWQYFIHAVVAESPEGFGDELVNGVMPDSNPAVTHVAIYHIDSLDDESFSMSVVGEEEYDESQELVSQVSLEDDDRSLPILPIALVVVGVAILILTARRWKK